MSQVDPTQRSSDAVDAPSAARVAARALGPRAAGYAKGRAKRQEIIETATRAFGESGFDQTSMVEIAARCSLSRAGLLHHFSTKESILEAVLAWRDDEDRARFVDADPSQAPKPSGAGPADGLRILRGMVDLAAHNASTPGLIRLYATLSAEATSAEHPAHDYFVARYDRIRRGTRRALEQARDAGHLREGLDVGDLTITFTALMDGLQVQWLLDPGSVDMAEQLRRAVQQTLTVPL